MRKHAALVLIVLVFLTACGGECKQDTDCNPRRAHDASCIDKKCVYVPTPNECGNRQCDNAVGENECTCPEDCGQCTGIVPGSTNLIKQCKDDQCIEDVKPGQVIPIYTSADVSAGGDKFKIETSFNQPFNLKKDLFSFTITLSQQADRNTAEYITRAELTATTADRRTITLATKDINKHLWSAGSTFTEDLILDFPTGQLEEELTTLKLVLSYGYTYQTTTLIQEKTGTIQNRYREKLTYVNPSATYPCPTSCDDGNQGTKDTCGPQTSFFCVHEPVANACGNYICDSRENKCTCPEDCGPCEGRAGEYLDFMCKSNQCVTVIKPTAVITPNSLFDDRSLGPIQLNNNYIFNDPFNTRMDTLDLEFTTYRVDPTVSEVIIETVRVLEGQQQVSEKTVDSKIGETPTTVSIDLPAPTVAEEERTLTLKVWYKYTQNGEEKRGNYQKPLGRLTLINPQ